MEKPKSAKIEESVNDVKNKCIRISVPEFIYEKDNPVELDREMLTRARREFPDLEFSDKLLDTEKEGENIIFLFHYILI